MNTPRIAPPLLTVALLAAALAGGLTGCQTPSSPPDQAQAPFDSAAVIAQTDSAGRTFGPAVEAGDFETQAALYAKDALYSHPMRPPARGRDSIEAVLRETTPPGATIDIHTLDKRALAPTWVYSYGIATYTFPVQGADSTREFEATYLALFHKTSEGWKIYRESLSLNHPPHVVP